MAIKGKERNEISDKFKWDLSIVYKDETAWEKDFNFVEEKMNQFSNFKGTLLNSSNNLLNALKAHDEIGQIYDRLSSYAVRKNDEDTRDNNSTKLRNRISKLGADFSEMESFFGPELMELDDSKLKSFLDENKKLRLYTHYLEGVMRFKSHTLSSAEEKIIASASESLAAPSQIFSKLNNADIKFGNIKDEEGNTVELTKGNYSKYIASRSRNVRKKAFQTLYKSYCGLKNTLAETLIGDIKANYFLSKNKKYNNPLEMSLYHNNIDVKVYDNVINVVHKHLDKMHNYVKLKKDVLGLRSFHIYDFYVDLIAEYDIDYSYEDALELIFKALEPLGEEYISKAKKVFDERWIDVYENNGKQSGAYSSFGYDTPPYILLNYNGKLSSVGTIIHELGHSMHTYHSSQTQPYIYHEYPIFVAEVASNVNEMLLNMYMLDHATNDQERLSLINDFLESVKGSIYRQTMFAEFEKTIYELEGNKQTLTEEVLSNLYYELNKKYYGNNQISDDEIRYEWMRIPHFYYQFYVYQYATGLTAAFFIANELYQKKPGFREKYLEFLSSGSSDYPLELLKKMGIDMTSEEPMNRILDYFGKMINEFKEIVNKK
jgi:oligoendopeptidase F